MSERPTPETDAFFRTFADGEATPSHAEYYDLMVKLERERNAERYLAERRGRLYDTAVRQLKALERDLDRLEAQLNAERALADRLAGVFEHFAKIVGPPDSDHDSRWVTDDELDDLWQRTQSALAAWKEARSE
jgi:hypothetical protein